MSDFRLIFNTEADNLKDSMQLLSIQPINAAQQQQVVEVCEQFIHKASQLYSQSFVIPEILFDLKGRAAGMYQVRKSGRKVVRKIRINPWLAAKYFDETLSDTVPHEVAHFVVDRLYGLKKVRPHGKQWQSVMLDFGVPPTVRGDYSLEGIPVKRYQRFEYVCSCKTHWLTTLRHNKILRDRAKYLCRSCGDQLAAV